MKNYITSKMILILLTLSLTNASVSAQTVLSNFPAFAQNDSEMCWAASLSMLLGYYGVPRDQNDIVSLAFDGRLENRSQTLYEMSNILVRLAINFFYSYGAASNFNAPEYITNAIDNGRLIVAGHSITFNNSHTIGHMYPIIGYTGAGGIDVGDIMFVDSDREGMIFHLSHSAFLDTTEMFIDATIHGTTITYDTTTIRHRWIETISMTTPPPARHVFIVSRSVQNMTHGHANDMFYSINTATSSAPRNQVIFIFDSSTYEEQVTISQTGTVLMSHIQFPTPSIKFNGNTTTIEGNSALRNIGGESVLISSVNVTGNTAIYNSGWITVETLSNITATSLSGYGIYNTGTGRIDLRDATVNVAIPFMSSDAIYDANGSGWLYLRRSPTVNGKITGFSAGRMRVIRSDEDANDAFNPGTKKYYLDPVNLKHNDVVVVGGAEFINNFELVNSEFRLEVKGNDLVAYLRAPMLIVGEEPYWTFRDALQDYMTSQWKTIYVVPGTYNESVLIKGNNYNSMTIESMNPTDSSGTMIRYRATPPTPQNQSGFNKLGSASAISGGIESYSALRIVDAEDITINGIDIDGDNAVYNAGSSTIKNGTLTATSNHAIYNVGTISLRNAKVSATSNDVIYNAGTMTIDSGTTVSATLGYAAVYNGSGTLSIMGDVVLSTAADDTGVAIHNDDPNGLLVLGNAGTLVPGYNLPPGIVYYRPGPSPTINGRIAGFGAEKIRVIITGINAFDPGNKKYTIAPANLNDGYIVVVGGASFINNFELVDTNFVLVASGNNIIAKHKDNIGSQGTYIVSFNLDGGLGTVPVNITVPIGGRLDAKQMPSTANYIKDGYGNDGKWYTVSGATYTEFVFANGNKGTPVTGNITLYLKWTPVVASEQNVLSAGPNPVSVQVGNVNFFWQGTHIRNGKLDIYDASGSNITTLNINDDKKDGSEVRQVASWNLKTKNGRSVFVGTYAIIGKITTTDGKSISVSMLVGVK